MATYYHHSSSNNPRDAAAMHYIREALPTSYSEVPVLPTNMMYMNYSSSSGSYSDALAGNAQQHNNNNCVEISDSTPTQQQQQQQEILSNNHVVEHDFSAWRDGRIRNEMLVGPSSFLHAGQNLQAQGLSLSLGTQIPSPIQIPSIQYRNPNQGFTSFLSPNSSVSGEGGSRNGSSRDENSTRNADFFPLGVLGANQDSIKIDPSSYGMSSIERTIPHSKYLKVAQQLLDEVVNVGKALKQPDSEKNQNIHELWKGSKEADGGSKNGTGTPPASSNPQEPVSNSSSELSPAERQDLQNKMTKLLAMLDEVDRRYKQYYHQMQIVVSSFDAIAGSGAAKPYTALALQTISRHFRCLRDAITGQIRSTRRSLGEQDTSGNSKGVGISRLRYVDQQLRQQRAFQQLGMMQQHAWRPQRGLPESSVSILRAWLFEHFLHPYPKDSDKVMLARQTGLTRSQVSNWFINARVRLWKPMVEEMYKEEIGDADMDESNSSSENAAPKVTKDDDDDDDDDNDARTRRVSEERGDDFQQSTTSTTTGRFLDSKSIIISARDVEMGMGGARRGRASFGNGNGAGAAHDDTQTEYGIVKLTGNMEQRPTMEECSSSSLFPDGIVQSDGGSSDRFMAAAAAYHMSELGTFRSRSGSSGVSLTLGLQHCEGGGSLPIPISIPMPIPGGGGGGGHHSFVGMSMSMRGPSDMYNPAAAAASSDPADFDCMDPGSQQHRFSSSSHLLHDFVA